MEPVIVTRVGRIIGAAIAQATVIVTCVGRIIGATIAQAAVIIARVGVVSTAPAVIITGVGVVSTVATSIISTITRLEAPHGDVSEPLDPNLDPLATVVHLEETVLRLHRLDATAIVIHRDGSRDRERQAMRLDLDLVLAARHFDVANANLDLPLEGTLGDLHRQATAETDGASSRAHGLPARLDGRTGQRGEDERRNDGSEQGSMHVCVASDGIHPALPCDWTATAQKSRPPVGWARS